MACPTKPISFPCKSIFFYYFQKLYQKISNFYYFRKSNRKSNPNESKVKSPPVTAYDTISLVARVQSSITGLDICWVCGEDSCLRCSGCKKALYCGEACYRSDWEKHGEWCKWRREILKMTKRNQRLDRVKEEVD